MELHRKELPPIGTWAFCLADRERGELLVIDAPEGAFDWARRLATETGCRIAALVLTHGHWDHMLDAAHFADAGVPVYAHSDDRVLIETPELMRPFAIPGMELRGVKDVKWLDVNEPLDLLGRSFELRHVPGHCPGNIMIYDATGERAFVGDVIFAGSVGRYDLPGGDFEILSRSIREQVYTLPDDTVLYPGHGPSTTVAAEKRGNPFVRP